MRYAQIGVWVLIAMCLIRIADFVAGWLFSNDPTTSTVSVYSLSYYAPFWIVNLSILGAALVILRRAWRPGIWMIFLLTLVLSIAYLAGSITAISLIWELLGEPDQKATSQFAPTPSAYLILSAVWSLIGTAAILAISSGTAHLLFFAKRLP